MKSQVTQTTGVFGRRKRLFLLSSLLIFSVFNTVFGQSPGGVNTNLRVWLKANAGFTPAAWTDQSGAGNTYTQTNATRQPSLAAANGAFNFNPSVNFNSHFMVVPSGKPFTANNKNGTVFVIVNHTSIVGNQDYLGFGATTTGAALTNANNPVVGMAGSTGNPYWYDGDWPISTGIANEVDKTALLDFRWTYNALTAQPILMSKNGVSGYSTAILTNLINTASGSILGSQPEDLKADMGEIIAYEENLTGTALEKVRSYLAIKYGLTLNHNYLSATGSTIYSLTGYANNVAGIGREDAQGLDQKQSKSVNAGFQPTIGLTSIATSNSANGATFTDATYLMWGNDGGSTSFGAALTAPSGLTANNRMNRIWKVQETGSVGTVKFAIPQVGSGGTVYLIRSTDATFDATDTWIPLSNLTVGSTNYLAGDINFNNGDYFTVATYITAPGCVASGLDFWLDPSKNVTKSGNLVTDWDDADANGNNPSLVQATTSIQPEFSAGDELSNFNPYIDFSGSDRLYQDLTGSSFSNSHTTFGVVNQYGTKTSYSHFIRFSSASNSDGGTHNWGLGYPDIAQSKVGLHYITAPFAGVAPGNVYNRVNGNRTILQNVPTLYSASLNSATGATAVGHNGNEVLATGLSGGSFVPYNSLTVGGGTVYGMSDNKTQEIIHYSRELTVQERQRVQTYLAIKHGITLDNQDNSAAIVEGDYILGDGTTKIWDKTANATYHGNILGIGRDDCQGLNQKQSKSVNGGFQPLLATTGFAATNLTNTSGFTADKSFLVAGSDNGATSYAVPMAFPAGVVANNRMTRIWKVQETGTVGTVKLAIPSSSNQTYLVISNDATFDLSDTYVEMTNYTGGGVNYLATDINFTSGQYFSFASYVSAPGCVAADLKMWLKADEGVTATANKVSSWADAGGNMTVVQNTATRQPTWVDNVMNFNPALDYTGGQSLTATTGGQAVLPGVNDPATIVAVSTNRTVGGGWKTLVSFGGPADYPSLHWYGDQPSLYIDATTTVHNLHTTSLPLNTPYIFNSSTNNASPKDVKVSYNGFLTSRQTFTGADGQFPTAANSNPLVIGAETDAAGEPLDGYLTEAIAYNRVLTDAELQRVNSYLGIKYGITLDHNYVNGRGFEVYDRSTFGNNVFGIGREICSGLHQKQSKSINANTKMTIGIADSIAPTNAAHPSGLATDTTYIVIGDNAGTGTTGYTGGGACAPPPTADKFTNLNYKVTETGSVQSVRIKFNAAGLDFNNTYPVYMQVATDAAFTNMISNVPMQWSGSNIETNYNFPASSTSYVRFIGNTTNLANVCTASTPQTFHFNGWWYGVKNKTIVANYGATANAGDMVMKTTVTDGTPNVLLYRPTVDWWPVFDGYGLFFPRYGNAASENSTMTTKIEFLSQATTGVANASATKLAAATASFMIWDLDGYIGSRDIVKVYGKIGSQIVDPKLTRNKYTALTLNHGGDPQSVIGGVLPWDLSYWGRLYVDFESPVEEIYIEYKQDATYAFKTYQDFRIGPITATCKAPSPKVKLVDNVYVYKQVGSPVKSGDKAVYKFAIQNLDCGNKTINFSDILPSGSGLTWADSSLATSLNFASNNAYGNSQTLTINGLVVPSGISYLVMEAKTSTTGTFNNQATYTVGANNYLSDDPNQSGINSPTPLTVIANDPDANLTIAKTVNAATAQQNGILTYTFVVTNPNGAAVKATVTDILPASTGGVSPTYVASSLTGASGAIVSPYDGESSLTIRDLSVPANGSLTLTIQANVGAFTQGDTIKNVATVTPDVSEGFRIIEKPSSEANTEILAPCAAGNTAPTLTATTRSNTCPATTANLSTITATNRPSGTVLTFHSATPATYGNRVADSTAVGAGTYYAAFYDGASGCFSNSGNGTTAVTVSINACITCTGTTIPKTTIAPSTGTVADNYVVNSQFKIVSLSAGGGYTDAGYGYRFGTPTATTDRNYKL
ncbi:MAG: hypothetical protein RL757_2150, partial [Bacteroidota bacterium]